MHPRNKKRPAHTPLGHAWESFENGRKLFDMRDYPGAIQVFESALKQFQNNMESEGEAMSASAIAAAYGNNGMHVFAIPFAEEALAAFTRLGHREQLAEQKQNMGSLYMSADEPQKAVQSFEAAATDFEELKNWERAGENVLTAANILARDDQLEQARDHFHRALDFFSRDDSGMSEKSRAIGLMQLAYLEKVEHDAVAAKLYYRGALEIFQRLGMYWETASCLEGMAALEYEIDELESAVAHAKEALDTYQRYGFRRDALRAKVNYRAVSLALRQAGLEES